MRICMGSKEVEQENGKMKTEASWQTIPEPQKLGDFPAGSLIESATASAGNGQVRVITVDGQRRVVADDREAAKPEGKSKGKPEAK